MSLCYDCWDKESLVEDDSSSLLHFRFSNDVLGIPPPICERRENNVLELNRTCSFDMSEILKINNGVLMFAE